MLNIIFLSPHSDPEAALGEVDSGGQCIYEFQLAKHLAMEGAKVTIYCRKKFNYPDRSLILQNFVIKRIRCGDDEFIPKEKLGPFLEEFALGVFQDLVESRESPDVIHGHYWDGGRAMLHLNHLFPHSIPMIWTPHSLGSVKRRDFRGRDNELRYRFVSRIAWETYSMLGSNFVIVSTSDERDKIREEYGIGEELIKVIPPGIDQENFRKASRLESRRRLGLPKEDFIFMTLGRMDKRKGYHNCIKAFARYNKLFSQKAFLAIFAGKRNKMVESEHEYRRELVKLAQELGVSDRILFRDSVDYNEVRHVYAASNVYLCLSDYEPFGLSILEAMKMGIPVLTTNYGGPVNIINNFHNGILVSPKDEKSAAYYMYLLKGDEDFRNMIISNGRGYIRRKYAWHSQAKHFLSLYERATNFPPNGDLNRFLNYLFGYRTPIGSTNDAAHKSRDYK